LATTFIEKYCEHSFLVQAAPPSPLQQAIFILLHSVERVGSICDKVGVKIKFSQKYEQKFFFRKKKFPRKYENFAFVKINFLLKYENSTFLSRLFLC
jgi:hypothetical protein